MPTQFKSPQGNGQTASRFKTEHGGSDCHQLVTARRGKPGGRGCGGEAVGERDAVCCMSTRCGKQLTVSSEGGPYTSPQGGPYTSPDGGPYTSPDGGPYTSPQGAPYTSPDGGPLHLSTGGPLAP
ncbi:unnamed protein product [Arctogadus glacialis]